MTEYVDVNMQSAQGFKDSVYQGAAQKMKEKFGIEVTSEQCKNQIRHQRIVWARIQELKRKSGVSWDENKKIIVMGEDEYTSHIQAFPKDAAYLNIPITNYIELEKVCGLRHATGECAKSASSQIPLRSQQIHIGDDEPSEFMDVGADGPMSTECPNVQVMEDAIETTKRPLPSSAVGGIKKKSKTSTIDQGCIDLQRKLFCSIKIIGGVALTAVLVPVVEERVLHAIPSNDAIDTVEVLQSRSDPSFVSWKGGTILAILDFSHVAWIHRADWIQNGIHIGSGRKYKDSYFLQAQTMCYIIT